MAQAVPHDGAGVPDRRKRPKKGPLAPESSCNPARDAPNTVGGRRKAPQEASLQMNRRIFMRGTALALSLGGTAAITSPAPAAEAQAFSPAAFDAAKAAGRPILIDVSAPWCPTCKAQRPILTKLEAEPRFKDLVVFSVAFDSQQDVLRTFNVRMQSTLICFKGSQETARSTGDTKPASLAQLLGTTL